MSLTGITVDTIATGLSDALVSKNVCMNQIKYSFVIGFGIFLIIFPFIRHKKSCYNVIAARSILRFLRLFIIIELLLIIISYYFYIKYGEPITNNSITSYPNNNSSWLYSYARPTFGLVFIGIGIYSEIYPMIRIICMCSAFIQCTCDVLSAFEINNYFYQVKYQNAPRHGYGNTMFETYYWRDIISISTCTTIFLLAGLLNIVIGWCDPQLIHASLISGHELDRYGTMHELRNKRYQMEERGILENHRTYGMLNNMNSSMNMNNNVKKNKDIKLRTSSINVKNNIQNDDEELLKQQYVNNNDNDEDRFLIDKISLKPSISSTRLSIDFSNIPIHKIISKPSSVNSTPRINGNLIIPTDSYMINNDYDGIV